MQLFPVFTTRDITLLGINHRVSLAPTTVTQTNHSRTDLLLLDITVSLCTTSELMWVHTTHQEAFLLSALTSLLSYSHKPESALPNCLHDNLSHLHVRVICSILCRCLRSFFPMSLLFVPFLMHVLVVRSAAEHHGWRNNSVLQSIWRAPDMDTTLSRFKV